MRNTKKAFTLVELIVVITILAILGTIAFISLQGYSAEARNAKRTSDLSSISSSLTVKLTNGMSVLSAVADSTNKNSGIALAGTGATGVGTQYNAGTVNYTALDMKQSEFLDPTSKAYVIGSTTLDGGVYQLAASIESDSTNKALVTGMFNQRTTLTAASTGTTTISTNKFTIPITDTGKFKAKDTVTFGAPISGSRVITAISSDGSTITFDGAVASSTSTGVTIVIALAESASLIGSKADVTVPVINDSITALPY